MRPAAGMLFLGPLVLGLDVKDPAVKLPGIGRVGRPDGAERRGGPRQADARMRFEETE